MDIMEVARISDSLDQETITKEIFNEIKKDPKLISEILKSYAESMVEDVQMIRNIVLNYNGEYSENESEQVNLEFPTDKRE